MKKVNLQATNMKVASEGSLKGEEGNSSPSSNHAAASLEVVNNLQTQIDELKALMNKRLDTELSSVNESITALHEQSLNKVRKLKRDLKAIKITQASLLESENNAASKNSNQINAREIEDSLMLRIKDYLRRIID